jgi:hypothetical protein
LSWKKKQIGRLYSFTPKVVGDGRRQSDTKGSNNSVIIFTITSLKLGQVGGKEKKLLEI